MLVRVCVHCYRVDIYGHHPLASHGVPTIHSVTTDVQELADSATTTHLPKNLPKQFFA